MSFVSEVDEEETVRSLSSSEEELESDPNDEDFVEEDDSLWTRCRKIVDEQRRLKRERLALDSKKAELMVSGTVPTSLPGSRLLLLAQLLYFLRLRRRQPKEPARPNVRNWRWRGRDTRKHVLSCMPRERPPGKSYPPRKPY